jgi:long-chain acyl-CoA synthetase
LFWSRVERSGGRLAHLRPDRGFRRAATWQEVGAAVHEAALGLVAAGRRPGDAVGILSRTRAEWMEADLAGLTAGCVTVPIYPTAPPDQVTYVVNDAGVRTLVVEDVAQLARVAPLRRRMPGLEGFVVLDAPGGLELGAVGWEDLRRRGRARAAVLAGELDARRRAGRPGDVATVAYTSGTSGPPRGVLQTHANHLAALAAAADATGVREGDVHLLFLPLAHAFARMAGFMGMHSGLVTAFGRGPEGVAEDLRAVRPHFFCAVPRFFEKARARILDRAWAAPRARGRLVAWALAAGRAAAALEEAGRPVPARLARRRAVADALVLGRIRRALGGRLRFAVSGGAPLARDVAEFFHGLGVLVLEGYGLTEACPLLTANRPGRFRFGSVGQAVRGVSLRIAPDGEVLARGPNIATLGYLNAPEATAETFDADGWLHTGDVGRLDEQGFLFITGRKKDLIVTSGGANVAPQNVEDLLRSEPLIAEAMVYGDRRPYLVALVAVSPEELGRLARRRGLPLGDYGWLVRHPEVVAHVERLVAARNAELPSYARVRRFAILPAAFSEEGGELTPTLKVRRHVVGARYREVIDSLYGAEAPADLAGR